jgi:hypothetical protein
MRIPQVDQQKVKLLPLRRGSFVDWVEKGEGRGGGGEVDGNLSEGVGFDGSESRVDPPDPRLAWSELHVPELCSLGEIK